MSRHDVATQAAAPANPVAGGVGLLVQVLTRQRALYVALSDLLRRKKEAIQHARLETVGELCGHEETLIEQIRRLDASRNSIVQRLAGHLGLASVGVRLANICAELPHQHRAALEPVAEELKSIVDRVHHESAVIRDAAEALSRHMSGILQTVQASVNETGVYERNGRMPNHAPVVTAVDMTS